VLPVLDNVSFALDSASRVAIIGPSGGGKTTLLRLINRLDDPDRGQILLDGIDVRSLYPPDLRRRVGMVFQQPFLSDATVRENLNRPLSLAGRDDLTNDAAEDALRQVNLPVNLLDINTRELSVGQQQRVAIARALVLQPGVLLLDEPTSALDLRSAEFILRLLSDLAESLLIMVIMVRHTIEQAAAFADRVLAVRDGQVKVFDDLSAAVDWSMPAEATESE
jgi:ABC-type methionine transport system ATPase subunit